MIPILLDPKKTSIGLAGRSDLAVGRLGWLRDGGADPIIFSDAPSDELIERAGPGGINPLPEPNEMVGYGALWIADLPDEIAQPLVRAARLAGVLVNWEDRKSSCDFHNPALVRRGDLLLSISTGGKSPGLASRLRRLFEGMFGSEWEARLDEIAAKRLQWKCETSELDELARRTNDFVDHRNWLPNDSRGSAS